MVNVQEDLHKNVHFKLEDLATLEITLSNNED